MNNKQLHPWFSCGFGPLLSINSGWRSRRGRIGQQTIKRDTVNTMKGKRTGTSWAHRELA